MLNNKNNQIDIWFDGKKIVKQKIEDILPENTFFPLFKSETKNIVHDSSSGIFVECKEVGNIGTYEVLIEDFDYEMLSFQLLKKNDVYQSQF